MCFLELFIKLLFHEGQARVYKLSAELLTQAVRKRHWGRQSSGCSSDDLFSN